MGYLKMLNKIKLVIKLQMLEGRLKYKLQSIKELQKEVKQLEKEIKKNE